MKLILYISAIAALAASTQTLAGALQDHQVTTTEDLIELCSGGRECGRGLQAYDSG